MCTSTLIKISPTGVATNTTLVTLDLRSNTIGDAGAAGIGQGLATNTTLKQKALEDNKISATGWNAIARAREQRPLTKNWRQTKRWYSLGWQNTIMMLAIPTRYRLRKGMFWSTSSRQATGHCHCGIASGMAPSSYIKEA